MVWGVICFNYVSTAFCMLTDLLYADRLYLTSNHDFHSLTVWHSNLHCTVYMIVLSVFFHHLVFYTFNIVCRTFDDNIVRLSVI